MLQQHDVHNDLVPMMNVLQAQRNQPLMQAWPDDPALLTRFHQMQHLAEINNVPVRYLFTMSTFVNYQVYQGQQYDWVLVNSQEDPLMQDPDGFPVPDHVLAQLQRIRQAHLHFDAIYVAHEVPHGTISQHGPLDRKQLLPPSPRAVQTLSAQLGNISQTLWTVATMPLLAIGGALSAAAALSNVAVGLDPILLGVIAGENRIVKPGEPAAWFYLAHWAYNQED